MQPLLAPENTSAATSRPARLAVYGVCLWLCLLAVTGPAVGGSIDAGSVAASDTAPPAVALA